MEKIISFDSGTTNTKVFLFSINGKLLKNFSTPTGISFPQPLFAEQNCNDWIGTIIRGIRNVGDSSVRGISGSFQGGTFVLLDKHLKPLVPAITWLDNRSRDIASDFVKKYGEDFFYRKTGYVPRGWSCLFNLLWIKKFKPEVFRKIARISFVADYVNYFFTGNFALDHTSAAITTLYNLEKKQWDEELLEIAGIKKQMLGEIVQASDVIGRLKKDTTKTIGLEAGIPVFAGGHDQYCASLGAGAAKTNRILVSCGTAWVLLATTSKMVFDPQRQFCPGPHVKKNLYGLMYAISNGGIIYDWGRKIFSCEFDSFKEPSGIIIAPEFNTGNGAILNLNLSTNSHQILQAIVVCLCFQVRKCLERVEEILPSGEKMKKIVMIGGATRNPLVAKLLASITGRNVIVPEISEAAGFGAMKLTTSGEVSEENISAKLFSVNRRLHHKYQHLYHCYTGLKISIL